MFDDFELMKFPTIGSIIDDIEHKSLSPLSHLREHERYWLLEFDLPMVNKKDIKITFNDNTINIEAKKTIHISVTKNTRTFSKKEYRPTRSKPYRIMTINRAINNLAQ